MKIISWIILFFLFLGSAIAIKADRRPVIGISDTHRDDVSAVVPRSYVDAVLMNGGIPVVIPLINENDELNELLNSLDGIIFTGGEDFDPSYYNERPIPQMGRVNALRDKFDLRLIRLAAEKGVPILGICRGVQLINIAFGGTLYQDLPTQYRDKSIRHRQTQSSTEASHSVIVEDFTFFSDIVKERMLSVNSAHHQAIKDVAKGFRIAGRSPDQIVEVIEKIDDENWILGVQFHPEMRVTRDNAMLRIFQHFVEVAGSRTLLARANRQLAVSRQQIERELLRELNINRTPATTLRVVTDTLYINKFVRDTIYITTPAKIVRTPADTVYISVPETKIVYMPADTVYKSVPETKIVYLPADTVYKSVPETKIVYLPADTVYKTISEPQIVYVRDTIYFPLSETVSQGIAVLDTGALKMTVSDADKPVMVKPDSIILKPVELFNLQEVSVPIIATDTLIFTPGAVSKPITKSKSQLKKEAQEKEKSDSKAPSANDKQRKKEIADATKRLEKEQKEKDKAEKKLEKEKERLSKQKQRENAKLDKKELKLRKKLGIEEKE